jgi:hypothetical protein
MTSNGEGSNDPGHLQGATLQNAPFTLRHASRPFLTLLSDSRCITFRSIDASRWLALVFTNFQPMSALLQFSLLFIRQASDVARTRTILVPHSNALLSCL